MITLEEQDSISAPVGFTTGREHTFNMDGSAARKVSWLMELRAFCSEASVVGLRYVANQSTSMFRRSVWVLLLLIGASFTTYQILDRITYYFSYPTNVNIRVQHVAEMRFPTITVCNENVVTLSGATALGELSVRRVITDCLF